MRVITGSARGMALKAPKGMDTRPTMDQVKETLRDDLEETVDEYIEDNNLEDVVAEYVK